MLEKVPLMTPMLVSDRRARHDLGATAVEYSLLVTFIAAVIVTIVTTVGQDVAAAFQQIVTALPDA